jgi:hypothetical protein
MSGRVIRDVVVDVTRRHQTIRVPLDAAARAALERDGSALISFETPAGEVQAFDIPLRRRHSGG